jgi:hypothetical protein
MERPSRKLSLFAKSVLAPFGSIQRVRGVYLEPLLTGFDLIAVFAHDLFEKLHEIPGHRQHSLVATENLVAGRGKILIYIKDAPKDRNIDRKSGIADWATQISRTTKFLANLASDHRKPTGQFVITPAARSGFIKALAPTARDKDMDDAADHPAVISARFATRVGRKMRLKPRKLSVSQPEKIAVQQRPPSDPQH